MIWFLGLMAKVVLYAFVALFVILLMAIVVVICAIVDTWLIEQRSQSGPPGRRGLR